MERERKKKICFVATFEMPVRTFLLEHLRHLCRDYDVTVIANVKDPDFLKESGVTVRVIPLPIERKVSLLKDLKALFLLFLVFRKERFHIVHSIMPKSGLLSMLAAFCGHVGVRIHTFTGQVWATRKGWRRAFLKELDKLAAACATHILADGPPQRDDVVREGVVGASKVQVIANGSIAGVDTGRFSPDPERRRTLRSRLGIGESDTVFLYLGRLNRDKGLVDLARAFSHVSETCQGVHLLIVGPDEEGMTEVVKEVSGASSSMIHFEGYTDNPEHYMAAADVFCLPSYREGFGVVIIEAAAAGIPAIGSRIYGITDAIENGVTGLFFEPGDSKALSLLMVRMVREGEQRRVMGEKARDRATRLFRRELVVSGLEQYYRQVLEAVGR